MEQTFARILKLHRAKGEEYSADPSDGLSNFNDGAQLLGVTPEMVLWTFAGKHWMSVKDYVNDLERGRRRSRTEPIESRIDDLIVYLCILQTMVRVRDGDGRRSEEDIPRETASG